MQGMEENNKQGEKRDADETKNLLGVEEFLETTRKFFGVDTSLPGSAVGTEE